MKTDNLHRARAAKNDEFYTQYSDIEKECSNYMGHFFNKIIYCNCDTADSNFVKYFQELKRQGKIKDVFYSGGLGGVDFRSPESIELLKKADIVVSNPPFSLFREYIEQLVEHDKKFLIIGNSNAVIYKNVFPLIMNDKLWIGKTTTMTGQMFFDVPDPDYYLKHRNLGTSYKIVDGVVKGRVGAVWFTNLEHIKRQKLILSKTYYGNESMYPKYDNLDAINVDKKADIPVDYYGVMGVPITIFDKDYKEYFNILGLEKSFTANNKCVSINGHNLYTRILIQRKHISNDNIVLTQKAA